MNALKAYRIVRKQTNTKNIELKKIRKNSNKHEPKHDIPSKQISRNLGKNTFPLFQYKLLSPRFGMRFIRSKVNKSITE